METAIETPSVVTTATPLSESQLNILPYFENATTVPKKKKNRDLTDREHRVADQQKNPEASAIMRQEAWPPKITESTIAVLSNSMVSELRALKAAYDKNLPGLTQADENRMILLEKIYTATANSTDLQNATDESLSIAFAQALSKEGGQYQPLALEILEQQQEALQVATGAYQEVGKFGLFGDFGDTDEPDYVSLFHASSGHGPSDIAHRQHLNPARPGHRLSNAFNRFLGSDFRAEKRALQQEGSKAWQLIQKTTFPKDVTFDIDRKIGNRELSPAQKEYIRLQRIKTTQGEPLGNGAKRQVDAVLQTITDARLNWYSSNDKVPNAQMLNMVNVSLSTSGELKGMTAVPAGERTIPLDDYGFEGETMNAGRTADRATLMDTMVKTLEKNIDDEIIKVATTRETREKLTDQITTLTEKSKPRALTAEEQKKITELSTELATFDADKATLDQLEAQNKTDKELSKELRSLKAQVPAEIKKYISEDRNEPTSLKAKEDVVEDRERGLGIVKNKLDNLNAQLTHNQTLLAKEKDPSLIANINNTIASIKADISQINVTELPVASKNLQNAKNAVTDTREKIAKFQQLLNQINAQEAQVKQAQEQKKRLIDQLKSKGYDVKKQPQVIREQIEAKKQSKTGEKLAIESAVNGDPFVKRQLEVLKNFEQQIMSPSANDNIQNRANQRPDGMDVKIRLEAAAKNYPSYDQRYLRTLQVLFSDKVTADNTEGRTLFQNVVKMLPPERFEELVTDYLDANSQLATNPTAGLTPDTFAPENIKPAFINFIIDDLHAQVQRGELGKMPPGREASLLQIDQVKAKDINVERTELQKEQNDRANELAEVISKRKTDIKFYIEQKQSAGVSWSIIATELNTQLFDGEAVLTDTKVEEMFTNTRAIFADNLRKHGVDSALIAVITGPATTAGSLASGETIENIINNAPVAEQAKLRAALTESNIVDNTIPEPKTIVELSEIVAKNTKAENRSLFRAALYQLLPQGAIQTEALRILRGGGSLEMVLSEPSFASEKENLEKALEFAQSADVLLAGLAYVTEPQDFQVLERAIRGGKPIIDAILQLEPARRTKVQTYVESVAAAIADPAVTLDSVKNGAIEQAAMALAEARRVNLNTPNPDETLEALMNAAIGVEQRIKFNQMIEKLSEMFPHYESVADLTARIVYDKGLIQDLSYAKMIATEVIKYQDIHKAQATPLSMPVPAVTA